MKKLVKEKLPTPPAEMLAAPEDDAEEVDEESVITNNTIDTTDASTNIDSTVSCEAQPSEENVGDV